MSTRGWTILSPPGRQLVAVGLCVFALFAQLLAPHLHHLEVAAEEHAASCCDTDSVGAPDAISRPALASHHPHHDEHSCAVCQLCLQLRNASVPAPAYSPALPVLEAPLMVRVDRDEPGYARPFLLCHAPRGPPAAA